MLIKTVIFDFDGVIGDTMLDNYNAWHEAFSALNISISKEEYFALEGHGRFQIAEKLLKDHNGSLDYLNQLVEQKEKLYLQNSNFRLFPEIEEIINHLLHHKVGLALVTGASRHRIESTLPSHISKAFQTIVTSDDVKLSKPSPEGYLFAKNMLNTTSDNCMVVENAPLGIQAAKRAGLYCAAISTTLAPDYLLQADINFDNHSQFLNWLKKQRE